MTPNLLLCQQSVTGVWELCYDCGGGSKNDEGHISRRPLKSRYISVLGERCEPVELNALQNFHPPLRFTSSAPPEGQLTPSPVAVSGHR